VDDAVVVTVGVLTVVIAVILVGTVLIAVVVMVTPIDTVVVAVVVVADPTCFGAQVSDINTMSIEISVVVITAPLW